MNCNTKKRMILLILCLMLLAGCANSGGKTGGGKTEQSAASPAGSAAPAENTAPVENETVTGDEAPAESEAPTGDSETEASDEAFQEQTPDQINGKGGGNDEDEPSNIFSAVTDSLISGSAESIPPEELRPDNDFAGEFSNGAYRAEIVKDANGEMQVTITSAEAGPTAAAWTMSGFFSDDSYRIRYADAVKTVISYGSGGAETGRETEYENGIGTIQFIDPDHFVWNNGMEPVENQTFLRVPSGSD